MNNSLRCNCLPTVIILLNLAAINSKSKNRYYIRIGTFIYGIIGCFTIGKIIPDEIGLQAAFEWVMLYSVSYVPFFEIFNGKLSKKVDRYYEDKEELKGLHYSKEEIAYSELVTEKITAIGNLLFGVTLLIFTMSLWFDKFISASSELYYLAKYNFIMAALSYFGVYIKKVIKP